MVHVATQPEHTTSEPQNTEGTKRNRPAALAVSKLPGLSILGVPRAAMGPPVVGLAAEAPSPGTTLTASPEPQQASDARNSVLVLKYQQLCQEHSQL